MTIRRGNGRRTYRDELSVRAGFVDPVDWRLCQRWSGDRDDRCRDQSDGA
jgi:hypothetical protein